MKVLIVFNHPAPYKVSIFNELAKYVDLTVIFERTKASDRPNEFYSSNKYGFRAIFMTHGYVGREGNISSFVKKYIKAHFREFDHIVMNGYSHLAEMKAISFMKRHHIRFSLLINGGVIKKESSLKKKYKQSFISAADFYMSPSKHSSEYLEYYGANPQRIYQYPYSNLSQAELNKQVANKNTIREKLKLPVNEKIFVNASQFIERKNNMELINIFKNRDERLLLIGEGKELNKYQSFISDSNIKNITILPFMKKEELFEYYQASDAFISLAKEDIFGHTILEALANHLPVIASNKINSALEYIKDDYNGYIIDINDINAINNALDKVLTLNSENCIKSIKNNTFEQCAKSLYDILAEENK